MSQKDIIDAIENDILKRPKEEPTFLQRAKAAAKRGLEEPVESVAGIGLGLKSALGMKEQAGQQAADIRREAAQPKEGPMPTTWEELEQTYGKEGAIEALKKFPTYVAEQILQSAPSMAAPLAVGAGAAALSGPAAPIVGPLAGLGTYGLQQFGQFMQRQAQEGATGETLAPGKAAAVAAATAPLGYFADRFALGLTKVPAKVLGEGALAELAKRTGASVAGRAATGAGLGILAEAPTEVIEQIAERWQAGLPLDTEDAKREYKEAFFGAAAVGGVGGAAAHVLGGAPDIERRPDLLKPEQAPPVAPEQQTPEQVATLPPSPAGFTADQATQLRREAAMEEQARLKDQADVQQFEQQALQEQRQAQGARVAGLPGFTGMPDANQQIITQARADQAAQIKKDEGARKAAINRVMKTVFSADPVMQTISQQRALEELGVPRAKANEISTADPTKQAELIEAEAPEFVPAERGQKKPRGETLFETPPEEKQEIADLRSGLALVNKNLKEAQAGKGNLFSYLKGKLIDRPGAFSLADIDKDNKRLRQLYNTKGQGALLEDLVADGALDEYLPFDNRSTIEGFDPQTAIEHIAEKLRNGENINEESTVRLRDLQNQKEELKSRIENLTSIPAANYELGQMAEKPREELTEAGMRDLEDDARSIGVDVDRLREELSDSMPSASVAEFYGAYQNALFAATSRDQKQDALYSQKGEAAPKADPKQEKMQRELTGKSMIQAAQWAVNNAPNPFAKLTANKTLTMLKELQGRGVTFNFEVQGGKERSSMLSGAEGVTHFLWAKEGTKVTVFLNGTPVFADQRGYPSGMTYDTLLHELLHVATRTSTKFLPPNNPLIKDLNELFNTVVRKYNADRKAGKLPPVLERYNKSMNNVLFSADELISWGMNDKEFQKYLSEIKVGDKTVFSQLIDLVRKLIGMAKPFETALDRLVRTTEGLLELDTEYLQNEMVSQTYSLGKPAPVQKAKPMPMRQQALFQRSTPVMRDTLDVRREGFFFDAKNSPLYQKRSAEDIKYPTKEQTAAAIARNATARKIMQDRGNVANGAYVGLRQDLNIKDANLLAVHQGKESLHEKGAGFFSGDVQTYLPVATLKNVYFKIRQTTREAIAEGREFKSKMGSADGQIVKTDQPNFDGIELRFNPFREHLFVDAMGRAVKYVDEATIVAGRAFARGNIEYYGEEDVPARAGTAPTAARLMGQGEGQIKPIIDEPSGNVSISQQQSLFMQQAAIEDNLQKRAEGFYIRADQSPLYQKRSSSDMPQVTDDMFQRALAMHAKGARVEGKGSKIEPGDYVGVRLDVPIREASKKIFPPSGLPIQSIHKGTRSGIENSKGFFNNPVLKYAPNITIKNVHFKIDQAERAEIATGRKKSPMGSADGQFVRIGDPNFDGIELAFNPKREHLFVDALGRAIKYADEITAMGDRVYARGMIEYYGEEDIPSAGAAPSRAGPMVLETAIQEPLLQAVPDTNDGRVSEGQQQSLFMQQGLFGEDSDAVALEKIKKDLVRYASGMSGLSDFETGAYARSGHQSSGVGVDVGLLSKNAIDSMAHAVVDFRVPVFVDSGAFGNFRQIIKGNQPKPLDFDAILSKYDDITNAIAEFNVAEDNDYPRPLFVMPDIVGNQRGSLDLIKKHKNWIAGELTGNLSQPIIPIQKGGLTLAQAYQEVVDTLGRDDFIVGIPSNAKAVSRDDLIKFLREAQPKRVHFLGAAADAKLNPLLGVVSHVSPNTRVTADASKVRSSILDGVAKGKTRQQAIMDALYDAQDVAVAPYLSESLSKQAAPTPTLIGQQSLEILSGMGREPKAPEPGYIQRVRQSWDNAVDNPKATAQAAQSGFRKYADMIETYTMSSDAALNNEIQRKIMESTLGQEEKIGALMNISLSQTVHSDAISNLFLMKGDVKFNKELSKWEGVDSEYNIVNLSKKLDEIAVKYGLTKEQIQLISHTAFEAKRTKSLIRFNDEIDAQVAQLRAMAAEERQKGNAVKASTLSEKASNLKMDQKYIHMTDEDIRAGMTQFELMPELSDAVDIWNGIRGNAVKTLVDSGLWTEAEADFLLSNADYVPFYREDQLEQGKGPKDFMRSLQVQAKERRLKGTDRPVNDIFDNMVRWTQYSINRAVRNRSAVALAETAEATGLASKVKSKSDGDNVISVWKDGKETFYSMEDPMFMQAFQGLESVSIPTIRWAAKLADVLRQSVVLYPMFAVAQIPQDSFAAMFSSGLKPQHALSIPLRAVKEFILTLANKSKTHNELKNFGVVGVRDFTSAMVRNDAEVYAGLKAPPGMFGKIKNALSHIAMASDNAVRQATYLAAQAQGLSQSEALEKAFEIFNVRRKGSSRMLALAGQLIPFFNAYLAAQTVAYKTITGVGTSPTQRAEAYKILFGTTASVMTLSILYAMMNGDDEDYLNKPTPTRDRLLMIPGSGGMSIPLRSDLFTLPKVIAEHTYLMLTDNGYEDGRKFRDSMVSVLANAFLSPTAVPQAIKPLVEVGINYDFFQGKPLIGVYQKNLETDRQFTDSTSELAKVLGSTGIMSPIAIDHIIRGMFGSVGGLVTYTTNPFLWNDPSVPRPELSLQDALATMPNASGFISKEYESALRKDFYQLREATGKASSTLADLKQRSPDKIEDYITDEAVRNRLGLAPAVESIARNLTKIRQAITQITNSEMPADEKAREIRNLREAEREMLKGVNLKEMREFAKI
jgi:hypothetical protein